MNTWRVALIGLAVSVGTIATTSGAASAVTKTQVQAKALSLSDMPIGWSSDSTKTTVNGCLSPVLRYPHLTEAKVEYEQGGNIPVTEEEVSTSRSPSKTYSTLIVRLDKCHSVSTSVHGSQVTAKVEPLSYPQVGNQSAAFNMNFTVQGLNLVEDFVVFRSGSYVAAVLLGDEDTVDTNLFQGFVTEALNKIEGKPTTPPTTF